MVASGAAPQAVPAQALPHARPLLPGSHCLFMSPSLSSLKSKEGRVAHSPGILEFSSFFFLIIIFLFLLVVRG